MSEGTITTSPLQSFYSKYIRFDMADDGTPKVDLQFGWGTSLDDPVLSSNVITLTSDGEFTDTMQSITNIGIQHRKVDENTWTFDLYDSFGTIQVEIWER